MSGLSPFIIFSGYNQRAVLAFCRFATAENIPFYIIATGDDDAIFHTHYRDAVVHTRREKNLEVAAVSEMLNSIRSGIGCSTLLILPSSEYLNRFFLQHREAFSKQGVSIPLCEASLYATLSDKESFAQRCKAEGFPVPEEIPLEAIDAFPVVLKPRCYFSGTGAVQFKPEIIANRAQLEASLSNKKREEVICQRYIRGASYYLLYYVGEDGAFTCASQENLIQQSRGGSVVAAISSDLHEHPIAARYGAFFGRIGFSGLIMVEIRMEDDVPYMIEANPRLWGPSQLFVDHGVPLFHAFAEAQGHRLSRAASQPAVPTRYFWSGGFCETVSSGEAIVFHRYTADGFCQDYHLWQSADVYLRPDSIHYYHHEIASTAVVPSGTP